MVFFFFFKQKTAYEIMPSLVGSEMCIRDSSRTIVRPVKRLRESLLQVREGDFKVRAQVETHDELGDMCVAFNDMAGEIDRLINQVYTTQLKENEAAIKALQMQINPHFLYNTLDMIKSMAEIYGAYQVLSLIHI